jgi:hypothetical protein
MHQIMQGSLLIYSCACENRKFVFIHEMILFLIHYKNNRLIQP